MRVNNKDTHSDYFAKAFSFPQPGVLDRLELAQLISGVLVSPAIFESASTRTIELGMPVNALLIKEGLMDEQAYFQRLAQAIGIRYIGEQQIEALTPAWEDRGLLNKGFDASFFVSMVDGMAVVPFGIGPTQLRAFLENIPQNDVSGAKVVHGTRLFLTSPKVVQLAFLNQHGDRLSRASSVGLANATAAFSAKGGLHIWQYLALICSIASIIYFYQEHASQVIFTISVMFAVFFFLLISLRLGTCLMRRQLALDFSPPPKNLLNSLAKLPTYSILVPLYREAHMLKQLTSALNGLDYPKAKLDIKLLLEETDKETIAMALAMKLPAHFDIIVVPDSLPRTKPKALNYGLQFAKGDFVVIYDAEDIPEPDQLKRALVLFSEHGSQLATVQAKLNFYNAQQNWLTKQFTIEYCSLFDGMLPALSAFGFPIPLGGTSNHFRSHALREVGGWDAYNVTEDADLGIRLYRWGYYSLVLPSTTYEEACGSFKNWLWQRTRWLKGWMQTYYVHMRNPFQLLSDLGIWQFIGFQAIIGGPIFSALAHPVFLGILLWQVFNQEPSSDLAMIGLWILSIFNLSVGYLATMWLGVITLRFRSLLGFTAAILTIPFYWILISLATYRALFQLLYAPFYWEKTEHKPRQKS